MRKVSKSMVALLLYMCLTAMSNVKAQYSPRLEYVNQKINAGDTIAFRYQAAGTPLENKDDVTCVLYYFSNESFLWKGVDVKLSSTGKSSWAGAYLTPKDAAFITLKFVSDGLVDNNNNMSYGLLLADREHPGLNAPASRAAWGLLRSPGYGFTIDGYLDDSHKINDSVTHMWLDVELKQPFVKGRDILALPYAQSLHKAYGEDGGDKMNRVILWLTRKDAAVSDLERAWYICTNVAENKQAADTIAQRIGKLAPVNALTKLADYRRFINEKDAQKLPAMADSFLLNYPYAKREAWFDDVTSIDYNRMFLKAVLTRIAKEDFSAIDKYLEQLPFVTAITLYYKTVEVAHHRQMISDSFLYNYSVKLMGHMEKLRMQQPDEFSYLSPLEWNSKIDQALFSGLGRAMYITHIEICNSTGRYEEALKYAAVAVKTQQYKLADLNDAYVLALRKTGRDKEMKEVLLKSIYENQASVEMLELLKADYKKEHGSEKGFDLYLQSLKNAADAKNSNAAEHMIKAKMPDFTMVDANGKKVSLSALKGKVVVLDFWAQWCVPCKASFPGMQLAVDRYKNDRDVVFYFVDTEEDMKSDYKQVNKKYLKDHNFNFNLLFDNPKTDGKQTGEVFERICKAFTISGIPQKILIDKQGNVRFITVGFKGSASALADELSEVIELTKNAQ